MVTLAEPTITVTQWPREDRCDKCGALVLMARGVRQGYPFTLDPLPVLPEGPCGRCRGRGTITARLAVVGHVRGNSDRAGADFGRYRYGEAGACPVCQGTGRRGEPLGPGHVVMDVAGIARPHTGDREPWEAAHRRHHCRSLKEAR